MHVVKIVVVTTLIPSFCVQAVLFCHDKVSSHDLYVPDAHFHPTAHDPVDIILYASIDNFQAAQQATHYMYSAVSSRDVPFNRKEGATIVYLERTNRPLVSLWCEERLLTSVALGIDPAVLTV